ncbi:hypothetical protein DFP73DRAFT_546203 [Morchella snyderi]|nr:hypothetical protein DFP73DRAFT_546203 [Morchella snyderi]
MYISLCVHALLAMSSRMYAISARSAISLALSGISSHSATSSSQTSPNPRYGPSLPLAAGPDLRPFFFGLGLGLVPASLAAAAAAASFAFLSAAAAAFLSTLDFLPPPGRALLARRSLYPVLVNTWMVKGSVASLGRLEGDMVPFLFGLFLYFISCIYSWYGVVWYVSTSCNSYNSCSVE